MLFNQSFELSLLLWRVDWYDSILGVLMVCKKLVLDVCIIKGTIWLHICSHMNNIWDVKNTNGLTSWSIEVAIDLSRQGGWVRNQVWCVFEQHLLMVYQPYIKMTSICDSSAIHGSNLDIVISNRTKTSSSYSRWDCAWGQSLGLKQPHVLVILWRWEVDYDPSDGHHLQWHWCLLHNDKWEDCHVICPLPCGSRVQCWVGLTVDQAEWISRCSLHPSMLVGWIMECL